MFRPHCALCHTCGKSVAALWHAWCKPSSPKKHLFLDVHPPLRSLPHSWHVCCCSLPCLWQNISHFPSPKQTINIPLDVPFFTQGPSLKVFVKKKVRRCGVWQIKPMTSLDQDPLSTKSNNSGFGGYSQMKIYKGCKNGRKFDILVWFGLVTPYMSS